MKVEDLVKLKQEVNIDLNITNENAKSKSLELPVIYTKYLNRLIKLSHLINRKQSELSILYRSKYHYYRFEYKYELKTKSEIESYIFGDKEYIERKQKVDDLQLVADFLDKTLTNIKSTSFTISNYINLRRFEEGQ